MKGRLVSYMLLQTHLQDLHAEHYRSDTVNSKWFIDKILLRIKLKFELQYEPIVISFDL